MAESPLATIRGGIQSQIVRGSIGSLTIKLTSAGLVLALTILLARTLGPAGYGLYAYVYALVWLMVVPAELGLPMLVVRETARARAHHRWDLMRGVWRWAAVMAIGLAVGVTLVAGSAAWTLAARFSAEQLATFAWGVLLAPLMVLGNLAGAALRGLRHVLQGQLPDLVIRYSLALALCAVGALVAGDAFTPDVAMALHAAAAAVALLAGLHMLARARPEELSGAQPAYRRREWLTSTIPLALVAGTYLIHQQTDIVILGLLVDDADVGIYRVAVQTSGFVAFGLHAVNMIAAPQFARLHALGDRERLQAVVTTTARVILALTALVVACLVLFGRPVIGFAFGSDYAAAYLAIVILAIGQVCNAAFGSVVFLLNMSGCERVTLRVLACAVVLNIGLNLLLIPLFGLEGAALATATTLALWNFLLWRAVRRHLGIDSTALGIRVPAPASP
ncbi:oligosaccharide flippase family protein [Spiribacter halobius]|uniref:Flippase n=1 Tax=Sediminicurvatus halobius TaxID=2182432 RepID=A0A2U2MWU2_9GAMM|nr:oligosaccharide flippase family protein [Spiribacter halobius]PWG61338.1 flippase [Spiribacter halobius]UEX76749.1 oligosaccharide flippase family protein [Spiribacter halobius]